MLLNMLSAKFSTILSWPHCVNNDSYELSVKWGATQQNGYKMAIVTSQSMQIQILKSINQSIQTHPPYYKLITCHASKCDESTQYVILIGLVKFESNYNAASFLPYPHKRDPIAGPLGWAMWFLFCVQVLYLLLLWYMPHSVIYDAMW